MTTYMWTTRDHKNNTLEICTLSFYRWRWRKAYSTFV